jgi:hypothetical protein
MAVVKEDFREEYKNYSGQRTAGSEISKRINKFFGDNVIGEARININSGRYNHSIFGDVDTKENRKRCYLFNKDLLSYIKAVQPSIVQDSFQLEKYNNNPQSIIHNTMDCGLKNTDSGTGKQKTMLDAGLRDANEPKTAQPLPDNHAEPLKEDKPMEKRNYTQPYYDDLPDENDLNKSMAVKPLPRRPNLIKMAPYASQEQIEWAEKQNQKIIEAYNKKQAFNKAMNRRKN